MTAANFTRGQIPDAGLQHLKESSSVNRSAPNEGLQQQPSECCFTRSPYTNEDLHQWLASKMSGSRYYHSLGAQLKAIELAENYGFSPENVQRCSLAGLLHDCAKLMTPEQLLEACELFEIRITHEERLAPQTLHPFVGAAMANFELGIQDEEILNAIRFHTTGRQAMSPIEKVVYVADKVEGNTRNPLYTQKIHALLNFKDPDTLDQAVLFLMESTMQFLLEKGQIIHPRTLEARNDLVLLFNSKKATLKR